MTKPGGESRVIQAVIIFEAHDVVFTQIPATLNFDHDQIEQARIFQTVFVAGGDVGGFIGVHKKFAGVIDDLGNTAHHDPVLAAVMVHCRLRLAPALTSMRLILKPFPSSSTI